MDFFEPLEKKFAKDKENKLNFNETLTEFLLTKDKASVSR